MVLDGDGSLLMNLGAMVTLTSKAPKNVYHFLFDNGVYAVTGGQPVPGAGTADWADMARAAGYAATFDFDNIEDLATGIDEVLATTGPVFVRLAITPEVGKHAGPIQGKACPVRAHGVPGTAQSAGKRVTCVRSRPAQAPFC